MVALTVTYRDPGEPMAGREIINQVLDATPEMYWQCSREEAASRIFEAAEDIERVEIEARDESGRLVGYLTAGDDDDPNVGPSLGIQHLYVLPEYRGTIGVKLISAAVDVARKANYQIVGYTRRKGEGRFELRYMRVSKGVPCEEIKEGGSESSRPGKHRRTR